MRVKFDSPTPYGMDATWDDRPLHCKWTDLSGRTGNRDSFSHPLLECDVSQSNYWEPMKIMVSEVDYESLMEYFKSLQELWTQAIHTVYIFVDTSSWWLAQLAETRYCLSLATWVPEEIASFCRVGVPCFWTFFFLRLPNGQYGPVSQLSRSEKCCTGPFNWGGAHCAGEKVKRKIGQFQRKSLWTKQEQNTAKGRSPPRQPGTPRPGSQVHGPKQPTTTKRDFKDKSWYALTYKEVPWTML